MKYSKILAIISIVIVLFCFFCLSSFAWSSETDSEGWTNVTSVDKISVDWPVSSMGAPVSYYDYSIPCFIGPVTADMDGIITNINIFFEGNYVLGDIIIPDGYNFKLEFLTELYTGLGENGGWATPGDFDNQYCQFYDSTFTTYKIDMESFSGTNSYDILLSCDFDNVTGKDLYLNNIVYDLNIPFLEDEMFDIMIHKLRFKLEKLDLTDTDILMGAINDSTNKITNGWVSKPQKPQGSEAVGEMTDIENGIMMDTQSGLSDTDDVLGYAPSLLQNFQSGFLFMMGLFGLATENRFIESLITISLCFGIFVFLLNLVPALAGRSRRESAKAERKSNHKKGG